jgi:signal transduction histidine kinase
MIMLITSSPCGTECAAALQKAIAEPVQLAANAHAAVTLLRRAEYNALVLDGYHVDAAPHAVDSMLAQAGGAVPVYVNFAISGTERVVREVQTALRRVQHERLAAMKSAAATLRNQLRSALTGILLSSDLALAVPHLPPAAELKIKFVRELAESMRQQLETAA